MNSNKITGYLHPKYAQSLSEFGAPYFLKHSGSWILERKIPRTTHTDAMGCYPLFTCQDWGGLKQDIIELEGKIVSLALVTDPFACVSPEELTEYFPLCYKFKDHYITDLSLPPELAVHKRTRKHALRALRDIKVERCVDPVSHLKEWVALYKVLIDRHNISGIRAFSEKSFESLLQLPGVELFIALFEDKPVGAEIFVVNDDVAYAHLVAINQIGYLHNASYALDWIAVNYFSDHLSWLDQGSGAGLQNQDDGLAKYKQGWTTLTRPVYFCGRILDQIAYKELSTINNQLAQNYFPIYRFGEYQ